MTRLNKLTVLAAAVALSVGLSACGGGGSSTTAMPEPEPTPEPMPDPAAVDLAAAQAAAMAAAAAANTASESAATAASGAVAATANVATQQTGEMARAHAMAASKAAADAMAASQRAAAASSAAASATTGSAAGAQVAAAEAAQAAAEAAAAKAADYAMKAAEAAMTELHIDGTMKSVGDSSLDAAAGTLTSYDDAGDVTMITGFRNDVNRTVAAIPGRAFNDGPVGGTATPTDSSDDIAYRQAVAAQTIGIGKVVDSTDDMARLTIVTGRAGSELVRVFADGAGDADVRAVNDDGEVDVSAAQDGSDLVELKSIGMFHEAMTVDPAPAGTTPVADALDFTDEVPADSEAVEVFSYTADGATAATYVVVESRTTNSDGDVTSMSLRAVDVTAAAAVPDTLEDTDADADMARVMAALPSLEEYSHIHFGVWAGLEDNEDGDNSALANLGIGFVQNHDGSGVTSGHVTGTAIYNGDWVAVVRPSHSSSLASENGSATLTANFSEDEFEAALAGLATLEGSLSGNMFSGTEADVSHDDMNSSGTFAGSFSGAIYGPDGAEAAGVFSFDGGDAGAFRGAFGGREQDQ